MSIPGDRLANLDTLASVLRTNPETGSTTEQKSTGLSSPTTGAADLSQQASDPAASLGGKVTAAQSSGDLSLPDVSTHFGRFNSVLAQPALHNAKLGVNLAHPTASLVPTNAIGIASSGLFLAGSGLSLAASVQTYGQSRTDQALYDAGARKFESQVQSVQDAKTQLHDARQLLHEARASGDAPSIQRAAVAANAAQARLDQARQDLDLGDAQDWQKHTDAGKKADQEKGNLAVRAVDLARTTAATVVDTAKAALMLQSGGALAGAAKHFAGTVVPGLGIAFGAIGVATAATDAYRQIQDLRAQSHKADALRQAQAKLAESVDARGRETTLDAAVRNVADHAGTSLAKAKTQGILKLFGNLLGLVAHTLGVMSNALTLVGVTAPVGLGLSLVGTALGAAGIALAGTMVGYAMNAASQKKALEEAITPDRLPQTLQSIIDDPDLHLADLAPDLQMEKAKEFLAGQNRAYALVHLAENLAASDPTRGDGARALNFLARAGMPPEAIEALLAQSRVDAAGTVTTDSQAVKSLGKFFFG